MRGWSAPIIGAIVCALAGACSDGSNDGGTGGLGAGAGTETSCQKLCRRAGEADAACAPSDCVQKCDTALPACDGEYRALVDCMANAQMLGCETNSGKPNALGECDAQESALGTCLVGGSGGAGGSGGSAGSGGSGASAGAAGSAGSGPCDPLTASCVACGSEPCGAGESCCWGDSAASCGAKGSCGTVPESSCDGAEDCNGGSCCVTFSIGQTGSASSGSATCSAPGSTPCCAATPGTKGCAADATVQQCVCAQDDYCCTTEWDAQCTSEIAKFGCGSCGAGCEYGNSSTGSGSIIKSSSCRTSADCAGVVGNFGVPYSECCRATNFGVGACVSQTYASAITTSGGSCN